MIKDHIVENIRIKLGVQKQEAKEEVEEAKEELEETETPEVNHLQERFKKLANIIK